MTRIVPPFRLIKGRGRINTSWQQKQHDEYNQRLRFNKHLYSIKNLVYKNIDTGIMILWYHSPSLCFLLLAFNSSLPLSPFPPYHYSSFPLLPLPYLLAPRRIPAIASIISGDSPTSFSCRLRFSRFPFPPR